MNKTIGKYICAWAVVCLAGCSNEVPQEGQTAVASFHVATRAADNTAEREVTDQQFVRLYVAERRPESGKPRLPVLRINIGIGIMWSCIATNIMTWRDKPIMSRICPEFGISLLSCACRI